MNHKKIFISSMIYVVIAILTGIILNDGLIIFLGWNILLATIPYLIALLYVKNYEKNSSIYVLIGILLLYVLFFPNTFYVLTDVIHFEESHFFERYPDLYHAILEEWILFFIIIYGVFQATLLGVFSLKQIESTFKKPIIQISLIITICFLSSIGIYIGRFLRLNSWQFFRLDLIFQGIFHNFGFFIGFVAIFTILQIIIYRLITNIFNHY